MTDFRIGVVGCGAVAEVHHLPAIAHSPVATLAAVVDADNTRAAAIARRYRAGAHLADYRHLPGMVDAAIVATSNATHAEITCFLLEHGVHVLCEKPLATTIEDAEHMVEVSRRGPSRLMAGHSRRFNPNVALLRELVADGLLGPVHTITAALGGRYGSWPQRTEFRRQRALSGGGVLLDLGIHLIDMAVWLGGSEVTVRSYHATDTLDWGVENDAEVVLALPNDAQAIVSCSYTHGLNRTLHVRSEYGWASTGVDAACEVTFFSSRARLCARAGAQQLLVPEVDPFRAQLDHFVGCIVDDRPFAVSLDDVLAGLRVVEQCYRVAQAA